MKTTVGFSKEELEAIKTIAEIQCVGIHCDSCPLSLDDRLSIFGPMKGCFRNIAVAIVREYGGKNNEE